ncbi:MAG TPA: hypothetical protein PKY30_04910, partial [Myxococcota bacterium]|nr:hypothetical protein [Myxococcota bacterium]
TVVAVLGAPLWLLLLAPLLFGVPHVFGDIWVLFLRPSAPRALILWLAPGLLALLGLRVALALGYSAGSLWEQFAGVLVLAGGALYGGSPVRGGMVALLAVPALLWPSQAALWLGHAHNGVAVGFLLWLVPLRQSLPVAVLFVLGMGAILSGAMDGQVPWDSAAGLGLPGLAKSLAPGLSEPWSSRLVLSFAFGQAVHYLCWVGLLPASTDFFGRTSWPTTTWLLRLSLLGTVGLCAAAAADPLAVRSGYLSLVLFHGWMELGALAAGTVRR